MGILQRCVLWACDELCEKMRGWRCIEVAWWWNEEVKEAVSRKKEAHKAMCQNSTEENKRRCKSMKNKMKYYTFNSTEEREAEVDMEEAG